MRAMCLEQCADLDQVADPLVLRELPRPAPAAGELLLEVSVCGVCHTELDEIEGRTPPRHFPVVPGHEIVGHVAALGRDCSRYEKGDRVGVGWVYCSDGSKQENLSAEFMATGRDANGGYAEFVVVPEAYAYPIPEVFSDVQAAPLLCAGGVGYRSLKLAELQDGQVLGLTGFGGSGHLVLQMAKHLYPDSPVFVFARSRREQEFARELGADWSGDTDATPPGPADAIIDTTPAWQPVLAALERLKPAGRLVINAIRKNDNDRQLLASLRYEDHLWLEKEIKSVANVTRYDIEEALPVAAAVPLLVETQSYALEDANIALRELRAGDLRGAKVLTIKQ